MKQAKTISSVGIHQLAQAVGTQTVRLDWARVSNNNTMSSFKKRIDKTMRK